MSRLCCWIGLGLLITLAGAVGCNNRAPIPHNYTAVGASTSSNDFAVSGGNLMAHSGKPGVMFGTVTKPKNSPKLNYVMLFKLPLTTDQNKLTVANSAHGLSRGGGEVKNAYGINSKRIEATAYYELNAEHTMVAKETLTVGGKEVDPAAGRLFLLDLTAATPAYQQKKIALPGEVPQLLKEADVELYAEALLKALQEKNPEIKEWLK